MEGLRNPQESNTLLPLGKEQDRYSKGNILRSEKIYGKGFQSPGAEDGFQETLLNYMPSDHGSNYLEIGSGLGGAAIHLATKYSKTVLGVDIAPAMIELASQTASERNISQHVKFLYGDIFSVDGTFDVIYSKDALMYEENKEKVFHKCFELLKETGFLCISDFGRGKTSTEFQDYIEFSGYDLRSFAEYCCAIEQARFRLIKAIDVSDVALKYLQRDLHTYIERQTDRSLENHSDTHHIIERWERKIRFIESNQLTQYVFIAQKY